MSRNHITNKMKTIITEIDDTIKDTNIIKDDYQNNLIKKKLTNHYNVLVKCLVNQNKKHGKKF